MANDTKEKTTNILTATFIVNLLIQIKHYT